MPGASAGARASTTAAAERNRGDPPNARGARAPRPRARDPRAPAEQHDRIGLDATPDKRHNIRDAASSQWMSSIVTSTGWPRPPPRGARAHRARPGRDRRRPARSCRTRPAAWTVVVPAIRRCRRAADEQAVDSRVGQVRLGLPPAVDDTRSPAPAPRTGRVEQIDLPIPLSAEHKRVPRSDTASSEALISSSRRRARIARSESAVQGRGHNESLSGEDRRFDSQ